MNNLKHTGGWIRQKPSEKDRGIDHPTNARLSKAVNIPKTLPTSVDLRKYDVPIVNRETYEAANPMLWLHCWVGISIRLLELPLSQVGYSRTTMQDT